MPRLRLLWGVALLLGACAAPKEPPSWRLFPLERHFPQLADDLRRRGVSVLPDPLVNAGAVIADSIERFSPDAWKDAGAKDVYAFVRDEVRRRASEYLNQREQGLSVGAALEEVAATPSTEPIGLSFGESE